MYNKKDNTDKIKDTIHVLICPIIKALCTGTQFIGVCYLTRRIKEFHFNKKVNKQTNK